MYLHAISHVLIRQCGLGCVLQIAVFARELSHVVSIAGQQNVLGGVSSKPIFIFRYIIFYYYFASDVSGTLMVSFTYCYYHCFIPYLVLHL